MSQKTLMTTSQKFKLLGSAFVIIVLGLVLVVFWTSKSRLQKPADKPPESLGLNRLIYFEEQPFWQGVALAAKNSSDLPQGSKGGIIPHHLLPGFILSDFFRRWQQQPPQTIILIGPNHKEKGEHKVLTSLRSWQTPFGTVLPNTKILGQIMQTKQVFADEGVVEEEHSVAGIMPYIKYYLPNSNVVPLVLKSSFSLAEITQLAKLVEPAVKGGVIVIAPVDFSHYLTAGQAAKNNSVTLQAMKAFDLNKIMKFSNDYVDSPPSIALFLKIMQDLKAGSSKLLFNTNSGYIDNNPFEKTTSYFSMIFY